MPASGLATGQRAVRPASWYARQTTSNAAPTTAPWGDMTSNFQRAVGRPLAVAALSLLATTLAFANTTRAFGQTPGPNEVILFTDQNFAGQSQSWSLPASKPYLSVPDLGPELRGNVGSALVGTNLGIALFERPFFESHDNRCGLEVGSSQYPDLWWTGRTATFEPAFGATTTVGRNPGFESQVYSSMLVFRRDLGPPPGALLMERRTYTNWACGDPLLSIYFNRLFIPIPEAPQSGRCHDLTSGAISGDTALQLEFLRSDRLYIMLPEMLNEGYSDVSHNIRVTLFDGPNCTGTPATYPRPREGGLFYLLSKQDFRNRARSVLISYEGGSVADYYTEPPPAHPQVLGGPETASRLRHDPPGRFGTSGFLAGRSGESAAQEAAEPPPDPAEAGTTAAVPAAAGQASGDDAPDAAQTAALPAPAPEPPQPNRQTFRYPVADIYRLNYCLTEGQCGEPAANAFCQAQGYRAASEWSQDPNIGGLYPTVLLGTSEVCAKFVCDGFKEITCTR